MHDHLEKGDSRDTDVLEVVRVGFPWLCITDSFLLGRIVSIDGIFLRIDELNTVVELWVSQISALDPHRQFDRVLGLPQLLKALSMIVAAQASVRLNGCLSLTQVDMDFSEIEKSSDRSLVQRLWWGLQIRQLYWVSVKLVAMTTQPK